MGTVVLRKLALVFAVAVLAFSVPAFSQSSPPNDATPGHAVSAEPSGAKENDADRDDPTSRLEWERAVFGTVTPAFRTQVIKEGRRHGERKNAAGPSWVNIGPTTADFEQNGSFTGHVRDSGRARTILPHPTDPNTVYFLTSGGGLWKTNNWNSANTKWTVLTDDLPTTGGGAVAFGKSPSTLYLGLGDPYDQILVGGAMVKSKNGGESWSPMIELGNAVSVRDVKVDTSTNRDIVFVATDNGLFISNDEGATYTAVPTFANMSVWSIARTSAGWLVSAQNCPAANVGLQCGLPTTLFLSTNLGATWTPITNAGNVFTANGRTTLAVANPGESIVYAYSSDVGDLQMRDVYRSTDGGQTWLANGVNSTKLPTNPVPGSMPNMNICHAQCWYNQSIVVDPRDPSRNTVWIGGDLATARTSDGGSSWTIKTWWLYEQVPELPYAHADNHAAVIKMTGTPTVILGDDGGLNVSTDDGATFSSDKNNGLVTHLYYTVSGNPALPNFVIGGLQDNGTRVRTDNSTTYNQMIGGDGIGAAFSQANTATVLGSSQGSNMRTNVTGNIDPPVFQNWVSATAGLSDNAFGFFTAIIPAPANLDPTGRVFFHFSNTRVWKTTNGGVNWTLIGSARFAPVSPGLPAARTFRSAPDDLGVSPIDLNHIAVGGAGGFLDVTTNGGATWTDINLIALVPGYQGFVTNVSWQDNQNLWITSVAQAAGSVRVIKASIAGPNDSWATATFTPLQNGLPDLPVTRILFDPRDTSRKTIYAATHVGIYRTTDGGLNWAPFGNGLPTVRVNDIYMPPDGGFMRIATYGRGIWELPQIEFVKAQLVDDGRSCDHDGFIDNGETGHLLITLANQGSRDSGHVNVTVTSSNPAVTFPFGNQIRFPELNGQRSNTGSIAVAVNGDTTGSTTFTISVDASEIGAPAGLNFTSSHRVNVDEKANASATETFEARNVNWAVGGDPALSPNILSFRTREIAPLNNILWGPDNNGQNDGIRPDGPDQQFIVSPSMHVGTGPLTITLQHRFSFENGGWDGGVIELSKDNGATWTDIGTSAYNGTTNGVTTSPLGTNHPAFVNRSAGWPNFGTVTLNLGTTFANQDVKLRFRTGADESTGAPGWDIDNLSVSGITNTPFTAIVPNACVVGQKDHDHGRD
jgi:hypothetical protein